MKPLYKICWTILRVYIRVFCKLQVFGIGNVPRSGGVIVASNHISAGDPPFVGASIRRESFFLAKKELFRNFFLRVLISNLNSIPVDRSTLDQSAIEAAENALRGGFVLILFPEGTRSKTGELKKGKPGVGLLARRASVPIVPAYIQNSRRSYKLMFGPKRLIINFGETISADWINSQPDTNDGYRLIAEETMSRIAELENKARNNIAAPTLEDSQTHQKPFA